MPIVELCNQVLPADVLHVVPGPGSVVGQALAANPKVIDQLFLNWTVS
jgi:acyl-CoA reductase-like NAD-dependent aldehyde dehydrogenase